MPISDQSSITGTFGPNLWLVEEMYQLFLDDPSAVDASWHEFFADYQPASVGGPAEERTATSPYRCGPRLRRRSAPEKPARAGSRLAGGAAGRRRRRRARPRRCGVRRRRW